MSLSMMTLDYADAERPSEEYFRPMMFHHPPDAACKIVVGGSVAPLTTFGSREFPLAPTLRLTIASIARSISGLVSSARCASKMRYLALSRGEAGQFKNLTDDGREM
jgi:hypothetical protein